MIPSVQIGTMPLSKVSELIDVGSWTWKEEVIRNNFIPPDADAILNIPLRREGGMIFGLGT
jgi:hypothetical protein